MMTPIYLNPPPSTSFPPVDDDQLKVNHDHQLLQTMSSCPTFSNTTTQDQTNPSDQSHPHDQHKVYRHIWQDESSDRQVLPSSSSSIQPTIAEDSSNGSVKWMSSKMRLMRKFINSNCATTDKSIRIEQHKYHHHHHHHHQYSNTDISSSDTGNNNNNNIVRVCSNCNTTKTPLWRSGPTGPKSLCNACGIRQRKVRRAMEAAANNGTTILETTTDTSSSSSTKTNNYNNKVNNKEKKSRKYKKKCKHGSQDNPSSNNNEHDQDHHSTTKKLCFEEFALNLLSKNSGFQHVFPQDEEEGAILLMALSYGLVLN